MPGKRRFHKVGNCVCLILVILVLCVSSYCGTLELVRNSNANAVKRDKTLYYLNLSNPSITQPIEPRSVEVEEAKFVQVEVAEVVNPKKYALTFEVHYRPKSNAKIYLGSFSLYPADNPGKFIVAMQGKVKDEGAIVLSMVIPDKVDTSDPIKVGVKKIKFLKG